MNKPFEIIKVEKSMDVYGTKHDVPTIKLSDDFSRENLFELDVAILGDYEDEFWCERWRKLFHALEYNVFYKIFDDNDMFHPMKVGFHNYMNENFEIVNDKFKDEYIMMTSGFLYNTELNDYFQFLNEPGKPFLKDYTLHHRMRSLKDAIFNDKAKGKKWSEIYNDEK